MPNFKFVQRYKINENVSSLKNSSIPETNVKSSSLRNDVRFRTGDLDKVSGCLLYVFERRKVLGTCGMRSTPFMKVHVLVGLWFQLSSFGDLKVHVFERGKCYWSIFKRSEMIRWHLNSRPVSLFVEKFQSKLKIACFCFNSKTNREDSKRKIIAQFRCYKTNDQFDVNFYNCKYNMTSFPVLKARNFGKIEISSTLVWLSKHVEGI